MCHRIIWDLFPLSNSSIPWAQGMVFKSVQHPGDKELCDLLIQRIFSWTISTEVFLGGSPNGLSVLSILQQMVLYFDMTEELPWAFLTGKRCGIHTLCLYFAVPIRIRPPWDYYLKVKVSIKKDDTFTSTLALKNLTFCLSLKWSGSACS